MRISHLLHLQREKKKKSPSQSGRSPVQQSPGCIAERGFSAVIRGHLGAVIWVIVQDFNLSGVTREQGAARERRLGLRRGIRQVQLQGANLFTLGHPVTPYPRCTPGL